MKKDKLEKIKESIEMRTKELTDSINNLQQVDVFAIAMGRVLANCHMYHHDIFKEIVYVCEYEISLGEGKIIQSSGVIQ